MTLLIGATVLLAVLLWPVRPTRALPTQSDAGRVDVDRKVDAPLRWIARRRARDPHGDADRVIGLVEGVGPAIRAGVPPATAVSTAAALSAVNVQDPQLRTDLLDLARAAEVGEPLADTWSRLAERHDLRAVGEVGRAWALSESLGCGLTESLDTATALARDQMDRIRRTAVATAGARATMQLLTLLPLVGIGIAAVMGIAPWRLYAGPLGVAVLALGVALIVAGRRLVRRLTVRACAPGAIR